MLDKRKKKHSKVIINLVFLFLDKLIISSSASSGPNPSNDWTSAKESIQRSQKQTKEISFFTYKEWDRIGILHPEIYVWLIESFLMTLKRKKEKKRREEKRRLRKKRSKEWKILCSYRFAFLQGL